MNMKEDEKDRSMCKREIDRGSDVAILIFSDTGMYMGCNSVNPSCIMITHT
jgi:hypothetical protein